MSERVPALELQRDEFARLRDGLAEHIGSDFDIDEFDGTYEIETDELSLSFTIEGDIFEIRNIEVRGGSEGLGRKIVEAVHDYADENDFAVIASNVLDTARGFWEKMGYQEGSEEGEYFRG